MKVYIIDISGRVVNYDFALYHAVNNNMLEGDIKLMVTDVPEDLKDGHVKSLLSFVPTKYKSSENFIKRILKALESVVNYIYILFVCLLNKPDILHFQWLPFSEICSIEVLILRVYKLFLPQSKLLLTIHNVYPHNYIDEKKIRYKKRFVKLSRFFDGFIVHTNESKHKVVSDFFIEEDRVCVVHHGIFEPDLKGIKRKERVSGKYRIISYGHQDLYKGTDLLLDAIQLLPYEYKEKVELEILGRGQQPYIDLLKKKGEGLSIEWKLYYVDDKTLYQDIINADVIVLPYRNISQSGVLLLALYFNKPIICSDLPAFVETLGDYPIELFFKSGDPHSLKDTIIRQLNNKMDESLIYNCFKNLREKYSWHEAGKKTVGVYKRIGEIN